MDFPKCLENSRKFSKILENFQNMENAPKSPILTLVFRNWSADSGLSGRVVWAFGIQLARRNYGAQQLLSFRLIFRTDSDSTVLYYLFVYRYGR